MTYALGALAIIALIVGMCSTHAAPTGACGTVKLAAQDLAGTCRKSPTTMGALEVAAPVLPKPKGGGVNVKPMGGGVTVKPK